jgi:hypothetical protein
VSKIYHDGAYSDILKAVFLEKETDVNQSFLWVIDAVLDCYLTTVPTQDWSISIQDPKAEEFLKENWLKLGVDADLKAVLNQLFLTGKAQIIWYIDDNQEPDKPLKRKIKNFDLWAITQGLGENIKQPTGEYLPEITRTYYSQQSKWLSISNNKFVHPERSFSLKFNNGRGIVETLKPVILNFSNTIETKNKGLLKKVLLNYQMRNLWEKLQDRDGRPAVNARFKGVYDGIINYDVAFLDMEEESIHSVDIDISSFHDLLEQSKQDIASAARIPYPILFGKEQASLGNSRALEIWFLRLNGLRNDYLLPLITRYCYYLLALYGKKDIPFKIEMPSPEILSTDDKVKLYNSRVNAASVLGSVIVPDGFQDLLGG